MMAIVPSRNNSVGRSCFALHFVGCKPLNFNSDAFDLEHEVGLKEWISIEPLAPVIDHPRGEG